MKGINMKKQVTIGDYLLIRLKEIGIKHIFGVPGDYNLEFLDQIVHFSGMQWVGNCNELNAAYAADGYARLKGAGAVVTTFGVGELSAMNGISGAYAELVPIVNIVGVPSRQIRDNQALVHHTLGDGRFTVFSDMYKSVTIAQTLLTEANATREIDRVIRECWIKKRPVYIALPSDIAFIKVNAPQKKLDLRFPKSNQDAIREICARLLNMLEKAKSPVVLLDMCAQRFIMKNYILEFLKVTGLPFASMNLSKGLINESHKQFIGSYAGALSDDAVKECVENSDCIISFGTLLSDFNTGGFTTKIDLNVSVEIHSNYTRIAQSRYNDVIFCDVIPALTKYVKSYHYRGFIPHKEKSNGLENLKGKITQEKFWHSIPQILEKNCTILAETGTSMFGSLEMPLPDGSHYIGQTLWGSIGFTMGGLLGACIAEPKRQTILFIGDGSFQLTAQELSTILRNNLTPVIFLLNNDGYTIERAIHGEDMEYNDIQMWDYAALPRIFGKNAWSTRVKNMAELNHAFKEIKKHPNKMKFIEVILDKMDCPAVLQQISQKLSEANY